MMRRLTILCLVALQIAVAWAGTPVVVEPVIARHGMVVAGHPQAAEIGLTVLKEGGNAIDAAVATSLALGVAEPFGSGLGGKLMLLHFEAKTGRVHAVDAMDAAGSLDREAYLRRPKEDRISGYGAVCVPGLGAGLWEAHRRWGSRPWRAVVTPAATLAREGFRVLPKTRDFFAEVEKKLRGGDADIARLYLPGGALPEVGTLLPNEDLARTLETFAREGRDGFYRGAVAEAIVAAARRGGGVVTLGDFATYEARVVEPVAMEFRGHRLVCAPPPTSGAALFLPILKALENESFGGGPLRAAANLDRIGRVWRVVAPEIGRVTGDAPEARFLFEKLIAPDSIRAIREKALAVEPRRKAARRGGEERSRADGERFAALGGDAVADEWLYESPLAATTHFVVADAQGNIVCATQSQSLHFGAGVVAPGTGVVLNNSMSNFDYVDPRAPNHVGPGKRPRSTIAPTIVFRGDRPVLAIGLPGSSRIPTAMLQVLLDRLAFGRPLAEAIGDTRVHYLSTPAEGVTRTFEAEDSLPEVEGAELRRLGWDVVLREAAGRGRYFGGINAIEFLADGTLAGHADPRRTNAAAGH